MPNKRNSKRNARTAAAASTPSKRARAEADAGRSPTVSGGDVLTLATNAASSASANSSSSSASSSASSFVVFSSASASPRSSTWAELPLELLLLVADCAASYRLLLPLSSTCRRMYELIHEEGVSGLVQAESSVDELHVRVSCWRRHPTVEVSMNRDVIRVDDANFLLKGHNQLFVSHVLTSLRNVPSMQLGYDCPRGSHAANLYPLRHFSHLRSLLLLMSADQAARQQNLTDLLATALLSLPSLASFTFVAVATCMPALVLLGPDTLPRLARERLLHITIDAEQYGELLAQSQGRRKRGSKQPSVYSSVQSVASTAHRAVPSVRELMRLFPNARHIALGCLSQLFEGVAHPSDGKLDTLARLDSLHVQVPVLHDVDRHVDSGIARQPRCLSLRVLSGDDEAESRLKLSNLLALTGNLEQLAIIGCAAMTGRSNANLEDVPSIFSLYTVQLSQLTYLQFSSGLLPVDLDHLLSSTSPPAFAASLTYLALTVSSHNRPHAAALLHLLPDVYPGLQRCHVGVKYFKDMWGRAELVEEDAEWLAAMNELQVRLGAVWCESKDGVREARYDVAWRRSAGLIAVTDDEMGLQTRM